MNRHSKADRQLVTAQGRCPYGDLNLHYHSYCYSTVLNLNVVLLHNNSFSSRNYGPFPFLTSFPRTGIGCRRYSSGGVSDSVNGACCNERQQRQSAILTVAVAAVRAAHGGVNGRSFLSWRAELRIHKSIIDRSERASNAIGNPETTFDFLLSKSRSRSLLVVLFSGRLLHRCRLFMRL